MLPASYSDWMHTYLTQAVLTKKLNTLDYREKASIETR